MSGLAVTTYAALKKAEPTVSKERHEDDTPWQTDGRVYYEGKRNADFVPAGVYDMTVTQAVGPMLVKSKIMSDDVVHFPDSPSDAVLKEILHFWTLKDHFKQRGLVHKRGVLLYGPPGTGKSVTVNQLIKIVTKQHNGIALICTHAGVATQCLQMLRKIEPDRPVLVVMEDLDNLIEGGAEPAYLALLDGANQVDNVVYVATTNHIKRLPKRLVNRPSRLDCLVQIGMPVAERRRAYLKAKEPTLTPTQLDEWVASTDKFTISHLKELSLLVLGYGYTLERALERLNKMRTGSFDEG